ncbi:MAG: aminotransferase class III-fold pyridoxal phosphate-dependent enzyme [Caldilineaceae bacterium]
MDGNIHRLSSGLWASILGHAHPHVNARVKAAIDRGITFASTTELEIEAAERIAATGMEQVRLSNSGSEATMSALRIALRPHGPRKFIKFEGNYHDNYDYVMFGEPYPGRAHGSTPKTTASRPPRACLGPCATIWSLCPTTILRRSAQPWPITGHSLPPFFVEPIMGNVAGITPLAGWLERIRERCDHYGVVLIFDEVKTGFRLANGGAQNYFGVRADLATLCKALGNDFPVSAIAGKAEIMAVVEPGRVAQGGTYCGNAVAAAAVCGTLEYLEAHPVIESIFARGRELMDGLHAILNRASVSTSYWRAGHV